MALPAFSSPRCRAEPRFAVPQVGSKQCNLTLNVRQVQTETTIETLSLKVMLLQHNLGRDHVLRHRDVVGHTTVRCSTPQTRLWLKQKKHWFRFRKDGGLG